jgi:hypothetical protein
MKEYMGGAINISLIEDDDGNKRTLRACGELIVLVSEPVFRADASGQMLRQREMSQLRFGVTSKSIRALIKALDEYADEMELAESRFVEKPPQAA